MSRQPVSFVYHSLELLGINRVLNNTVHSSGAIPREINRRRRTGSLLPNFTYGLSVFGASDSDLTNIQNFLERCFKRKYISNIVNIRKLLEEADKKIYRTRLDQPEYPLSKILPKKKDQKYNLRKRNISVEEVKDLKVDFMLNDMIEKMSLDQENKADISITCETCQSDVATGRCDDCCEFMCEFCITAHGRFLRTKQHKITGVKEATVKGKSSCKSHYCPRHKGERLTLLCDTCDELICRDCAITTHQYHKINFTSNIIDREKDKIKAKLEEVKSKQTDSSQLHNKVVNEKARIEAQKNSLTSEIDDFINAQISVEEVKDLKVDFMLNDMIKKMSLDQENKADISITCETCQSDVATGRCDDCCEFMCEFCITSHRRLLRTNQHKIIVNDSKKQRYDAPVSVEAYVQKGYIDWFTSSDLAGPVIPLNVVIQFYDDGYGYEFTYTPPDEGCYQLSVTVNGEHVRGSPFQLSVRSKVDLVKMFKESAGYHFKSMGSHVALRVQLLEASLELELGVKRKSNKGEQIWGCKSHSAVTFDQNNDWHYKKSWGGVFGMYLSNDKQGTRMIICDEGTDERNIFKGIISHVNLHTRGKWSPQFEKEEEQRNSEL
ncbi:predicted protein [Nematostella vectensis]|uniref:B box-type domain-containing protein n=1 Tax=Nematostella vectensis TaxID=45351 RepID=A7ST73_NEMVE|nr:predicted protein [Nematostella vectensis]|eukprot:XP_001625202.1 predicted protein [Nematostella vectensis]